MNKKTLFALILMSAVSGCGNIDRSVAGLTGGASKTCVDGVSYLQFTSGATVQIDRQGNPVPC